VQDQLAQLQPIQARQQSRMHSLMVEEQTLFHEMEYLQKKAMLRDGKVVSSLECAYVCMFLHAQQIKLFF